jgi:hypothetical protein
MREVYYGSRFRKDFRLAIKRGLDMSLIREVMENLENEIPLDKKYVNHGHSNIATTADIYSHIRNKTKKKALDKLNRIIKVNLTEQPAIKHRHLRKASVE